MIRVLHSELQSNIGGIEAFLLNLTKTIDKTNLQFDFLMRGNNPYLENTLKNYGANIYKVPSGMSNYYKFVKNILVKNNYDFVHVHKNSAANIVLPLMVKKFTNAKLIVHSHNTSPSSGSKIAIMLHKINRNKLIQLSDYRFSCSDTAAEWMFGDDYTDKQVKIIKNGIITKDYVYDPKVREQMRQQLNLEGKFVIGDVGAFREQKNHKFLLDIFSKLDIPNAELVLVGDGNLREKIETRTKELGIQNKVKFLGSRNDINRVLQGFDLFVMPSLWEGLSVSAVEAQASGLRLILSKNVSHSIKVTSNVQFLNLNNIDVWINGIKKASTATYKRKDESESIVKSGYDMSETSSYLRKIYQEKQ